MTSFSRLRQSIGSMFCRGLGHHWVLSGKLIGITLGDVCSRCGVERFGSFKGVTREN